MKKRLWMGQSLIELLLAIGVATLLIPGLLTGFIASREGKAQQRQRQEATRLIREAYESLRVVREKGWKYIATNGMYHPVVSGTTWSLEGGSKHVSEFERAILIENTLRDASGAIVKNGGAADPSTKKVIITVSWGSPLPSTVSMTAFLARYLGNTNWVHTTQEEFDLGTKNSVITTNINGGEVAMGAGGNADWCKPNLSIAALDLPKQGVANALSAIEGRVFAGTGENASGVSFANVAISNTAPPVASILGTLDGYKTNSLFGEENYLYIATDTNDKEIVIIDLSKIPYEEIGFFNSTGPTNGNSVMVVGNVGYMTAGNTFYTFDLTARSQERSKLGSVSLSDSGMEMVVVGGYAFVAVDSDSRQLEIINISDPSKPDVVGWASLTALGAVDVFVDQTATRAYVATKASDSSDEVFIFDVSTKEGAHEALGSYNTGNMSPRSITVVPGNRAIVVGVETKSGGEEYQVLNISKEKTPVRCGGLQIDTGIYGVASVIEADGDAYSYIITGDAASELKIIEGGPGGQYATKGTFESSTFDAGDSVAFNRFMVHATVPSQTTLTYQIAVADAIGGSCSGVSFTFVGPDETPSTYFTNGGTVPLDDDGALYENPGQCARYKAYFTTSDPVYSPVFEDVAINYSP